MEHGHEVIIVGAGTSGLAAAACLTSRSIPYLLLERENCCASLWKKYAYDRLHLHLSKQVCELPLMPFPSDYPTYVSKNQFTHYLDDYVSRFQISPLFRRSVELALHDELDDGRWRVRARNLDSGETEEYSARFLVIATGESCDPFVPEVEGLETFTGEVLHSTRYKNGEKYGGKRVLVVGSGNSGMEIALDLSNYGAHTSIVVRSPTHIVSRGIMNMVPALGKFINFQWIERLLVWGSKLIYGDTTKYGIERPQEGPVTLKRKYNKYPVIDVGTLKKIKSGEIQVLPAVVSIRRDEVVFENGKSYPFEAIIFATGFRRSTHKWLKDDELLKEDGLARNPFPNNWKGKNGLYCCGLGAMGFGGAAKDAQSIANDINSLL